jgi:hypothetical protein
MIDSGAPGHNTLAPWARGTYRAPNGTHSEPMGFVDGGGRPHPNRGVRAVTMKDAHSTTTFTLENDNDCAGWISFLTSLCRQSNKGL